MPTHNKRDDALRCLGVVLEQAREVGGCEVVVIDDGSRDGTTEALMAVDPVCVPLRPLRLPGCGPAVARNAGIAAAKGEILVMVDDDAVPQTGWLRGMLAPFEDASVVGVEGKVVPVLGEEWGPLGMSPRNLDGGVYLTCNCAYRTEALRSVGGFDEGFPFPAFEDTDLAMQMLRLGKIAWAPDAAVHHPRRKWSLQRALRELQFNQALTRFALRYKCLGWTDRPSKFPRLRILWSAAVALPLGRVRTGCRYLVRQPANAIRFIVIAILQGLSAWVVATRAIAKEGNGTRERIGIRSTYP